MKPTERTNRSEADQSPFSVQKGLAKEGFAKTQSGERSEAATPHKSSIGDSIKKTRPELNFDMPGGGPVRAQFAAGRVNAENGSRKFEEAAARAAEKKLSNSRSLSQNFNEKTSDKGRE